MATCLDWAVKQAMDILRSVIRTTIMQLVTRSRLANISPYNLYPTTALTNIVSDHIWSLHHTMIKQYTLQ